MGSAACADAGSSTEQQQRFFFSASTELRDTGTEAGETDTAAGAGWNLPGDREFPSTRTRSLADPGASAIGSEAERTSGTAVIPGEVGKGPRVARQPDTARTMEPLQAVRWAALRRTFCATGEACTSSGFGASTSGVPSRLRPQWDPRGEGGLPDLRGRRTSRMVGSIPRVRLPSVLGLVASGEYPRTAAHSTDSAAGVDPRGAARPLAGAR